ncbi:hypothetical protein Dimus_034295 [Dionaea muscipula]
MYILSTASFSSSSSPSSCSSHAIAIAIAIAMPLLVLVYPSPDPPRSANWYILPSLTQRWWRGCRPWPGLNVKEIEEQAKTPVAHVTVFLDVLFLLVLLFVVCCYAMLCKTDPSSRDESWP